jgi:hypothetical protein
LQPASGRVDQIRSASGHRTRFEGTQSSLWQETMTASDMLPAPQHDQLMSKHGVLGFKPQLRPERRG